jgi:DNA-binding XRE family transcriptional regulator
MTVGEKLRKLRGCRTTIGVAKALGISHSSLVKYERDERVPRDEVKKKIAEYYGKTVGDIFFS